MLFNKMSESMSQHQDTEYILSCYYYCAGEPSESGYDIIGHYKTSEAAEQAMNAYAREQLKGLREDEEERLNELRKLSENKNIKVKETDSNIILERQNGKLSYEKATYKMKRGLKGLVVGSLKGDGDENNFHHGGYKSHHNYCIYKIITKDNVIM